MTTPLTIRAAARTPWDVPGAPSPVRVVESPTTRFRHLTGAARSALPPSGDTG